MTKSNFDLDDIRADIAAARAAVVKAEQATLSTVMIRPTGKIEVVDKGKLEELNAEIERLRDVLANNEAVLRELEKLLNDAVDSGVLIHSRERDGDPGIRSVDIKLMEKRRSISDFGFRFKHDLADIIKNAQINPEDIYATPEVRAIKEEYEAKIEKAKSDLARLEALWESVCAVREKFKPSGCPAVGEFSQAIGRKEAGGMA